MKLLTVLLLTMFLTACTYERKLDVDSPLMRGLIKTESGWNPKAVSHKGARGLTQVMPATGKAECGLEKHELFDSKKNIECGKKYLEKAIATTGNISCESISLYNLGIYARPRCLAYGKKVLKYAEIERQNPYSTVPPQFRHLVD